MEKENSEDFLKFLKELNDNKMLNDDLYETLLNPEEEFNGEINKELSESQKNSLERKIDEAFKSTFLKPREKTIIDFFKKIQNFELDFGFGMNKYVEKTYVINLFYSANCPLEFIFVEPCSEIYPELETYNRPELHLDYYSSYDIELLGKKIVQNEIDSSNILDDENFELAEFWENRGELENKFLIECWKKAKKETETNLVGYLIASDSSGGPYFLDDTYHIWKTESVEIKKHLEKLGIEI